MSRQHSSQKPAPWASCLRDFLDDCDGSQAQEQAARLREARTLLACAPLGLAQWHGGLPEEIDIEAMIAAHAYESAGLALLPSNSGYMVSRGSNGMCLASIILDDADEELTSSGRTPALALLSALALSLVGKADAQAPRCSAKPTPQGMRLN